METETGETVPLPKGLTDDLNESVFVKTLKFIENVMESVFCLVNEADLTDDEKVRLLKNIKWLLKDEIVYQCAIVRANKEFKLNSINLERGIVTKKLNYTTLEVMEKDKKNSSKTELERKE